MNVRTNKISGLVRKSFAQLEQVSIQIPDKEKAEHYTLKIGPHRILGYAKSFNSGARSKSDEIEFDDVLQLYKFDRKLRLLALDALERVEVALKSEIDHVMTSDYGENWLREGFLPNTSAYRSIVNYAHSRQGQSDARASRGAIYELTFGKLSKIYEGLPGVHKKYIAKNQYATGPTVLESCLRSTTYARNTAAHHEQLWDVRVWTVPIIPNEVRNLLPEHAIGENFQSTYFAQSCIIFFLLSKIARNTKWHIRLNRLLEKASADLPALPILDIMGFPSGWLETPYWAR